MRKTERLVFDFETNAWVGGETKPQLGDLTHPSPAPEPGRWTRPAPKPRFFNWKSFIWGTAGVVVALSLALHRVWPLFILLAFAWQLAPIWIRYGLRVPKPGDLSLFEDPDDPEVCLVEMEVFVDGQSMGRDRGVVWFADGLLLYSGHRTSFALGGEDVLEQKFWHIFNGTRGVYLPELALPLRLPKSTAYVALIPIRKGNDIADRQEMRFLKKMYEFRLRPPRSHGPRQWPPLEP